MASPDAKDDNKNKMMIPPAQLSRTLAHMNKDHRLDLQHVLQHFNSLPERECVLPEMLDLDFEKMTVRVPSTGKVHEVLLVPGLKRWEDRRAVLVEMTKTAREALGIVDVDGGDVVTVTKFVPPGLGDWVVIAGVVFYFVAWGAIQLGHLEPGRPIANFLDDWWPDLLPFLPKALGGGVGGGCEGFRAVTERIFWIVVFLHTGEAWFFERSRLKRHGVRRGTRVWWVWLVSSFVEGIRCFQRFDRHVKGLQKRE